MKRDGAVDSLGAERQVGDVSDDEEPAGTDPLARLPQSQDGDVDTHAVAVAGRVFKVGRVLNRARPRIEEESARGGKMAQHPAMTALDVLLRHRPQVLVAGVLEQPWPDTTPADRVVEAADFLLDLRLRSGAGFSVNGDGHAAPNPPAPRP